MNLAKVLLRLCVLCAVQIVCLCVTIESAKAQAPSQNAAVVAAANAFLATLNAAQRQNVSYAYDDLEQRARWSNFPTGFVARGGISLKQMTAPQQAAALALMKTVLSPAGWHKVEEIRQADDDFKANGSKHGPPGGPPGNGAPGFAGPPPDAAHSPHNMAPFNGPQSAGAKGSPPFAAQDMFGADLYYISFLGTPSISSPWMLQFGGHHLALNITMSGPDSVLTPTLTGAQPAQFVSNGATIRPLGRENDKALALLQSLDAAQRQQAVLNYQVADLVLGPGQDGKTIAPEGLGVSSMSAAQKGMLLDLISEWTGLLNDASARVRMAALRQELDQTWFAWSGPTDFQIGTNITAYYRIQGPHLVIEYAPQRDEPANHVHTMYRDPSNDYGRQFSAR